MLNPSPPGTREGLKIELSSGGDLNGCAYFYDVSVNLRCQRLGRPWGNTVSCEEAAGILRFPPELGGLCGLEPLNLWHLLGILSSEGQD